MHKWLLMFLLFVVSCDSNIDAPQQTKNNAKELYIYSSLDTNEAKIYIRAFEKDSGIKVHWVRMSAGEVLVRIRSESENPQVGVWFGGPSPEFIIAKNDGLLAPYKPNLDFTLPPGAYDKEHYWTGFYFGILGFACNSNIMNQKNISPPTSWQDLLKPEFRGEIGIAYAYTSGTSYTVLASLVQMMGEEAAFEYINKLDKNIHHYNKSGSACVTQVGFGEIGVGIAFSHDIIKKGPAKGFPVFIRFPKEGTGYEIGAVALVKNGPNQREAKIFMDWVMSLKAQNMLQKWYRRPLHPKAERAKDGITDKDFTLIKFDADKAGKNKKRLIERWREITAQ